MPLDPFLRGERRHGQACGIVEVDGHHVAPSVPDEARPFHRSGHDHGVTIDPSGRGDEPSIGIGDLEAAHGRSSASQTSGMIEPDAYAPGLDGCLPEQRTCIGDVLGIGDVPCGEG